MIRCATKGDGADSASGATLSRTFIRVWLALLIAVSVFIRVHGVNEYAYSVDEFMHTSIASGATLKQVLQFSLYETHPPMLYILAHYWMMISDNAAFMRGLSLVFGIMLILLYYRIGEELNGSFTGICCATLIAFSRGCIILSYVVRHYAIFLFFISLAFYCYLLWRKERRISALAGYAFFACLAAASHFSAIFAVFCIATCETISMLRRRTDRRDWIWWIAANAPVAILAGALCYIWLPTLILSKPYFGELSSVWWGRIGFMVIYPVAIGSYFFPNFYSAFPLVILFMCIVPWLGSATKYNKDLQFLSAMMGFAFALGMALCVTDIYNHILSRHSVWIYPFIVPVLGWLLSDVCTGIARSLDRFWHGPWLGFIAVIIFAAGWAMYSPAYRFLDYSEYAMTHSQHDEAEQFFSTLKSDDLIVMARDDAVLFENPYPFLGDDAFSGAVNATLMPYQNTQILFNPFFRRITKGKILSDTLLEAQATHKLDGVRRLVFFHSLWTHAVIADLIACAALDKQVVAFPPAAPGHSFTAQEAEWSMAIAFIVPKAVFFKEVLAGDGKAHDCIATGISPKSHTLHPL